MKKLIEPQFLTELYVTPLEDGVNWKVLSPLRFIDSDGEVTEVPDGFTTDFASIPPLSTIAGWILVFSFPLSCLFAWLHMAWPFAASALACGNAIAVCLIADGLNCCDALDAPAALHDYGYRVLRGRKTKWDGKLYRGMKAKKVFWLKRFVVFQAVHFAGRIAWNDDGRKAKIIRAN